MSAYKRVKERLRADGDHGSMGDVELIEFANLIIEECIQVCRDVAEDVENGDIFRTKERLENELKQGHLGALALYMEDRIREHFNDNKSTKTWYP